jgi:NADPH:quinone reductase-like Zn-dependent oxidoreductase
VKSFVICSENFDKHFDECLSMNSSQLHNQTIHYALIECKKPHFDPEQFPNFVLVRKKAFSCNYREMGIILQQNVSLAAKYSTYYPIGSEFSGIVEAVGKNVHSLAINDRVIANGEYPLSDPETVPGLPSNFASNEYEILHCTKLMKIPDRLSFEVAAAFTIGAQTTYSMIEKLNIQEGKKILITGMNSNTSLFAFNCLKHKPMTIYGLARSRNHKDKLLTMGLKDLFVADDSVKNLREVEEINHFVSMHGGFDYVIDPFADRYLFKVIDLMNMGAKYVTCGISNQINQEFQSIDLNEKLFLVFKNNLSIIGNCLGTTQNLVSALNDYSNGKLDVIIDKVVHNDIKTFFERTFLSKERFGKVIFSYS